MNTNYYHTEPLSREEKEKAYSELEKTELIKRLIDLEEAFKALPMKTYVAGEYIGFSDKEIDEAITPPKSILYQICPKCNGEGFCMNFDQKTSVLSSICDVCNGAKIIPQHHEL